MQLKKRLSKKRLKNIKTTLTAEGFSLELPPAFTFKKDNNKALRTKRS